MSALDTAKEIGRMAATTTLSKDVIDLLKEKVALLAEQVSALETENANLKKKVTDLEQQLARVQPNGELEDDTVKMLKLFFEHDRLLISQIAGVLGMSQGMANYHRDILVKEKMISLPAFRAIGRESPYYMLPKGREYLVRNRHV